MEGSHPHSKGGESYSQGGRRATSPAPRIQPAGDRKTEARQQETTWAGQTDLLVGMAVPDGRSTDLPSGIPRLQRSHPAGEIYGKHSLCCRQHTRRTTIREDLCSPDRSPSKEIAGWRMQKYDPPADIHPSGARKAIHLRMGEWRYFEINQEGRLQVERAGARAQRPTGATRPHSDGDAGQDPVRTPGSQFWTD